MSANRKKGWHPDPLGRHEERYYYADDQPGRLVRDGQVEAYDDVPDLPPTEVAMRDSPPSAPPAGSDRAASETVPPIEPSELVASAAPDAMAGGPMFEDERVPWATRMSQRIGELSVPRVQVPKLETFRTRRPWLVGGAAAIVVVAAVALGFGLSGSGNPGPGPGPAAASGQSHHPPSAISPGSTTTPTATPASVWRVTASFAHGAKNITDVSCPSFEDCFAVGETTLLTGFVVASTDGGNSWVQQPVPNGVGGLAAISCASPRTCVAVGGITLLVTTDGGATWSVQLLGHKKLTSVSCPSTTTCVVAGENPPTHGSTCALGSTYRTVNGGASWAQTALSCFMPNDIVCVDGHDCEMVGDEISVARTRAEIRSTSDGGHVWSTQFADAQGGTGLFSIACPSQQICVALGSLGRGRILTTTNGGLEWSPLGLSNEATNPGNLDAVACASTLICHVDGPTDLFTKDGGTHWVTNSWPQNVTNVDAVTCPLAAACLAAGTTSASVPVLVQLG